MTIFGIQVTVKQDKLMWRTATSYLFTWEGTVRDTKWISVLNHTPPTLKYKNLSSGKEYEPEGKVVYDLEVKKEVHPIYGYTKH